MTDCILHGGEVFGTQPLADIRTTPAGKFAQERLRYLSPDDKPFIVLTSYDLEKELAHAYHAGQQEGECKMRQLLIRFLGVMTIQGRFEFFRAILEA